MELNIHKDIKAKLKFFIEKKKNTSYHISWRSWLR